MKIPQFHKSKKFVSGLPLACSVAHVKNSTFPNGIAKRYVRLFKTDPVCEIYLRGKRSKTTSKWQQDMLDRIFAKSEWITEIARDLKKYERIFEDSILNCGLTSADIKYLKRHGLLPFFAIETIVVDEIERKVIFYIDSSQFDEHGLAIYFHKGRWHLGESDRFSRYLHSFDHLFEAKEKSEAEQLQSQWDHDWSAVFPIPTANAPRDTNFSFLYGEWQYDKRLTARILKMTGETADSISTRIAWGGGLFKYRISKNQIREYATAFGSQAWQVLKCEHYGTRVRIEGQKINKEGREQKNTPRILNVFEFCCYQNRLALSGRYEIYRKIEK